jgi:uncharacterized protein (TIGR01777 family)
VPVVLETGAEAPMIVERITRLPFSSEAVWAWHTRPGAFERLAPPWERVRVVSRTGGIENGARVTLEMKVGLFPLTWVALQRDVEPGRRFVDEQVAGPFSRWVHLHEFTPDGPGGCVLRDRIEFVPPLGPAGAVFGEPLVQHKVERMLQYRHDTLRDDLAAHSGVAPRRIVVSGATGLIGSTLVPFLTTGGHHVTRLVRRATKQGDVTWDPDRNILPAAVLEGVDVVIHLAGANIAGGRWTTDRKNVLVESRVRGTGLLARTMAGLTQRPSAFVSVSGVGIYGDRGDAVLDDDALPGTGFLADLAQQWERAANPAAAAGIRVTHPRLGIVFSPAGGALGKLLPPFLLGMGGPMGSGHQWMSPGSIDDTVGALHFASLHPELTGAFNAVGPEPITNAGFARTLGRVLGRPALLPVPAPALRLLLGEMADQTLLASQRALPARLTTLGFRFRHPTVEAALRHVLGRVA